MKKILTICLALAMMFALSVNVFAANSATLEAKNASNNMDVTVKVQNDYDIAYSVTVYWESLDFTYHIPYEWNDESHEYDEGTGYWARGGLALVTVENHSSQVVTVEASIQATTNTTGVTADIYPSDASRVDISGTMRQTIAKPTGGSVSQVYYTVTVADNAPTEEINTTKIATVTITIVE